MYIGAVACTDNTYLFCDPKVQEMGGIYLLQNCIEWFVIIWAQPQGKVHARECGSVTRYHSSEEKVMRDPLPCLSFAL